MIQEIPDRVFYRIREVCTLTGLRPHILRYWEQEFKDIRPTKSTRGQRLYRKRDVEAIVTIKKLLYEKGFTIDGARRYMNSQKHVVDEIKEELAEIMDILKKGATQ
jgi:DNA-binding transcriptional MerR regulator